MGSEMCIRDSLEALRKTREELKGALLETLGNENFEKELELLRFQENEIAQTQIESPKEEERLKESEILLANATGNQYLSMKISETLKADSPLIDEIGKLLQETKGNPSLEGFERELTELIQIITDISSNARNFSESIDVDPQRLDEIQQRIALLQDIRRKYGETLQVVLEKQKQFAEQIQILENADQMAQEIQEQLQKVEKDLAVEEEKIETLRKKAAPKIAREIELYLHELSIPDGKVEFHIDGVAGEQVEIKVALNHGQELQPLRKVASGGELARTTLAARLVLSTEPETLIFDEVDAGIGGQTALEVGNCLKELSADRQVLVVTHLAQVASYADTQIQVVKEENEGRPSITVRTLDKDQRVVEISRMLSGSPDSENAQKHANELLENAH